MHSTSLSSRAWKWFFVFLRGESRGVTTVMAIVAGILVAICLIVSWRLIARDTAESPQRAILTQAERLLEAYHGKHGYYPETLEELPFRFAGDGQPETLKLFTYQSDGEHYALVTHSVATGAEMKSCR
jgi:hypothetical protein